MADVTFGVKVSEETKEKVQQMVEVSGMKSKEWFETLVSLYEMEQLKQGAIDFSKDLSELEIHTNRINQLVANMVTRAAHEKEAVLQQIEEIKASKDEVIQTYQKEFSEVKGQIDGYKQQAVQTEKAYAEAAKHVQQLEETNENNKALIGEYKEKIDTLSSLVNEYKEYRDQNRGLMSRIVELEQDKNERLTEVSGLTNELSRVKEKYEVNLTQAEERHKEALERLQERLEVARERELLGVRTQYQEKLQQANEEYTAKIQLLYDEINELRKRQNNKE
jgi:DNA repair exonuclease SbcCD ATPase subunit